MCPAALRERREYFSSLLGILCITSFSAFPTQLNQQVTSANLSEIGVMQRLLSIRTTRSAKNTALQKSRNEVSASPAMLHCNSLTFARIFCLGALHSRNFSVTQAHTELG